MISNEWWWGSLSGKGTRAHSESGEEGGGRKDKVWVELDY